MPPRNSDYENQKYIGFMRGLLGSCITLQHVFNNRAGRAAIIAAPVVLLVASAAAAPVSGVLSAAFGVAAVANAACAYACRSWPVKKAFATVGLATFTGLVAGTTWAVNAQTVIASYHKMKSAEAAVKDSILNLPIGTRNSPANTELALQACSTNDLSSAQENGRTYKPAFMIGNKLAADGKPQLEFVRVACD